MSRQVPRSFLILLALLIALSGSSAAQQAPSTPDPVLAPSEGLVQPVPPAQPAPRGVQTPPRTPAPGQPPRRPEGEAPEAGRVAQPPVREPGQPINIRIEVSIHDQRGSAQPITKVVQIVLADRQNGRVRSEAFIPGQGPVPLNVDAGPTILADGKIRLFLALEYKLFDPEKASPTQVQTPLSQLSERVDVVLESGKPLAVSQSADPIADRKVTVEVKATVLR